MEYAEYTSLLVAAIMVIWHMHFVPAAYNAVMFQPDPDEKIAIDRFNQPRNPS